MADLVKTTPRQIEPEVRTEATPSAEDLLQARADIQASPALKNLFLEGLTPAELSRRLSVELAKRWPEGDPQEAAKFLADEYAQIGPEGVFLISTETGRIAAIIREDDIRQPAPVPREGSTELAQPLPQIRPDLEAAIVTWFHDQGREQKVMEALAARGHQTPLLREMGDPRLLVASRKGRRHIVESLGRQDPQALLEAAGGTSGMFLRLFEFSEPPPEKTLVRISGTLMSKTVMGVQDILTTNLHHNRPATIRAVLVQGWVREIARRLSLKALEVRGLQGTIDVLTAKSLPGTFWVASPDLVRGLRGVDPRISILPVEGAATLLIEGPLGYLKIPPAFETQNFEAFARWEAHATLSFDLWVDLSKVRAFLVEGVEVEAQVL